MGSASDPDPGAVTPDLLADLQAGLLDDAIAARVRRLARSDPEAARILAGLDTVRRELARLGSDEQSAPEVPPTVTAKVSGALRTAPPASPDGDHRLPRPRLTRAQWAGLGVGVCAVAAAVVVALLTPNHGPGPAFPSGPTASQITVESPARPGFPLAAAALRPARTEPLDLGPLADLPRRASCLAALGYSPTAELLGGRQVDVSGQAAILLLVAGSSPGQVNAVLVALDCGAAHPGLIAATVLPRP